MIIMGILLPATQEPGDTGRASAGPGTVIKIIKKAKGLLGGGSRSAANWIGVTQKARDGLRNLERMADNLPNPKTGKLPGRWKVLQAARELDSAKAITGSLGGRIFRVGEWVTLGGRRMEFDKVARLLGRDCIVEDKSAHGQGGAASPKWMKGRASFIGSNLKSIRRSFGLSIDCFVLFLHPTVVAGNTATIAKNATDIIGAVNGINKVLVFVKRGDDWVRQIAP